MKKIYSFIFLITSILFCSIIWDYIKLPFNENLNIPGEEYLSMKHNPLNDTVRFIFFITVPLIFFLISKVYFEKENINDFFKSNNHSFKTINKNLPKQTFLFIVLIVLLEFILLDLSKFIYSLDIFHEGLWLTASNNLKFLGKFWEGSYIGRGLFGNFNSLFFWNIFGHETIGVTRLITLISILINKLLLILISYKIVSNINLNLKVKNIFFVILSIFLLSFVKYDLSNQIFYLRHFLLLIFLYLLIGYFQSKRKKDFFIFILGIFSSTSMFWYVDIGVYINISILFLILIFFIQKKFKSILILFFSIFLGWLIFFTILNKNEFNQFLNNTYNIFTTIEYIQGLIFPTPFWSQDARSTRALLMFTITGVLLINILINKNLKLSNENKIIFLFLYFISLISFKTGLSRSDTPHIKQGLSFLYIPMLLFILLYVFYFIEKKLDFNYFKKFNIANMILIIFLFKTILLHQHGPNLKRITEFPYQLNALIIADDSKYLSKEYNEFLDYYSNLTKDEKCIQIFTNETALPYLLKKPTCTKFYFVYTSSPNKLQEKFISELKANKPKYILYKSDLDTYDNPIQRLTIVNEYILSKYTIYNNFNKWIILKLI